MTDQRGAGRARISAILFAMAFAWSLGLIVFALFGPVYASESASSRVSAGKHGSSEKTVVTSSGHSSLVEADGAWTLAPASVPALIVVAVWLRLRHARSREDRGADPVVWSVIALLVGFSLISAASIGLFLMPAALLLALAAAFAPRLEPSA